MKITGDQIAQKLFDYIANRISLEQLVDWAETLMMDAEIDDPHVETVVDIIARLGLADVKEFGITWDDCKNFLTRLGYRVNVSISKLAA